jgi:hypothetical protein
MNFTIMTLQLQRLSSFACHAFSAMIGDAILCAIAGALYGIVFGGFGAQTRDELTMSGMLVLGTTCGIFGFAVGAVIGMIRELTQIHNVHQRSVERQTKVRSRPLRDIRLELPLRQGHTRPISQ